MMEHLAVVLYQECLMEWMAQLSLELVIMMEVVVGVANFWMVY